MMQWQSVSYSQNVYNYATTHAVDAQYSLPRRPNIIPLLQAYKTFQDTSLLTCKSKQNMPNIQIWFSSITSHFTACQG